MTMTNHLIFLNKLILGYINLYVFVYIYSKYHSVLRIGEDEATPLLLKHDDDFPVGELVYFTIKTKYDLFILQIKLIVF